MSYNIPLTGQVRLGHDFNRCFYHGASNAAQLNFNNERVRNISKTNSPSSDLPFASGAQKNVGAYRGTTGAWGYTGTSSDTNVASDQQYQDEVEAGGNIFATLISRANYNVNDGTHNIVDYQYADNGEQFGTAGNAAVNNVCYMGYLEPGNYYVYTNYRQYNAGYTYLIVRGYTSGYLSGSSSNYYYRSNYHFSGSFDDNFLGATFTVNSTYPYVILDIECHNDNIYYNRNYILRKASSYTSRNTNPCLVRY